MINVQENARRLYALHEQIIHFLGTAATATTDDDGDKEERNTTRVSGEDPNGERELVVTVQK